MAGRCQHSAKVTAFLRKLVVDFVSTHGGNWERPEEVYGLVLKTRLGTLHVNPYSDWTIFCRFDDVAKASEHFGCGQYALGQRLNPFSGKWNFHWTGAGKASVDTAQSLFDDWRRQVEPLLELGCSEGDETCR